MPFQYEEARYLKFEVLEYPGGNEFGKWKVDFEPITLKREVGIPLKANVTISLRSPRLPDKAITSGILKIRITDIYVFGNIRWPKEGSKFDAPFFRIYWFFLGIIGRWGSFSGKVVNETLDVDILVKVKPSHAVNFETVKYYLFHPDEIASIPIVIQNLGNYKDTFSFRVVSEHDEIKISDPFSITLEPGDKKSTYLGVEFAPTVFDYGTIHNIKIETYSIAEPNSTIATETITLESKGVYFSEISAYNSIFLLFIIVIIILFFILRKKNIRNNICVKPDKPWELPEEKQFLESLKEKDDLKYKETRKMMDDEYKSSLLWYENYVYTIRHPKRVKTIKIKKKKRNLFEKKAKSKKTDISLKKINNDKKTKVEKNLANIDKKDIIDDKKQKVLRKIKKSQEKQKRKVRKSEFQRGG